VEILKYQHQRSRCRGVLEEQGHLLEQAVGLGLLRHGRRLGQVG